MNALRKFKKYAVNLLIAMAFLLVATSVVSVYTQESVLVLADLEDELEGSGGGMSGGSYTEDDKALADYIGNHRNISSDALNKASDFLSPATGFMGNVFGGIVIILFLGTTLITLLDLCYIYLPPIRKFLFTQNSQGTPNMGGGGYQGSSFGGSFSGGGNMQSQGTMGNEKSRQWVSDGVVKVASIRDANAGNNMNGQPTEKGSVVVAYIKVRFVELLLLSVCVIVLTSSVLMGCGANLALWLTKLLNVISNAIPI